MNELEDVESGYVGDDEAECNLSPTFTDISIFRVTTSNTLARATRFGRQWLLKALSPSNKLTTSARRRLMKEFEIHSRLNHPSVVRVAGCETVEDLGECIIMEWIEGSTLMELLQKGELPAAERRRILFEIVDAVAYLHSLGIVHRDLKPSNIMIRRAGGGAVLIDFGLADTDDYVELKQSAGTKGYISPEQIANGGAHTSDDIYSLGVIIRVLYPEYSSLADLCTSDVSKRPNDAGELRSILRQRASRPRRIAIAATISGVILAAAITGYTILDLKRTATDAQRQALSLSESNSRNQAKVAELTDSLDHVTARMTSMETEKQEAEAYAAKVKQSYESGKSKIDAVYKKYDRIIHTLELNEAVTYATTLKNLYDEMNASIDAYSKTLPAKGLTPADCEKITFDLNNYYLTTLSHHTEAWNKHLFPDIYK